MKQDKGDYEEAQIRFPPPSYKLLLGLLETFHPAGSILYLEHADLDPVECAHESSPTDS